jgi:acyl-CoA synthetase (AMP-forming)/AMP-acid ligase II
MKNMNHASTLAYVAAEAASKQTVLRQHPDVREASVIGAPSKDWGETPVAFVVAADGASTDAEALRQWANARLGNTQRLAALRLIDALPRSSIGKVLKRELRERFTTTP